MTDINDYCAFAGKLYNFMIEVTRDAILNTRTKIENFDVKFIYDPDGLSGINVTIILKNGEDVNVYFSSEELQTSFNSLNTGLKLELQKKIEKKLTPQPDLLWKLIKKHTPSGYLDDDKKRWILPKELRDKIGLGVEIDYQVVSCNPDLLEIVDKYYRILPLDN